MPQSGSRAAWQAGSGSKVYSVHTDAMPNLWVAYAALQKPKSSKELQDTVANTFMSDCFFSTLFNIVGIWKGEHIFSFDKNISKHKAHVYTPTQEPTSPTDTGSHLFLFVKIKIMDDTSPFLHAGDQLSHIFVNFFQSLFFSPNFQLSCLDLPRARIVSRCHVPQHECIYSVSIKI